MPVEATDVDKLVGAGKRMSGPMMRPFRTSKERYARIDAAVERYDFKSFNKFMDAAAEWFIAALAEKEAQKKKGAKK